jgi:uncharacterized membrane protein YdjX (TVP38/TMEM64 family)
VARTRSLRCWLRRGVWLASALVVGLAAWTAWDREALRVWIAEARPLPFFTAMALLPAFGVPITPFFILAGVTFGRPVGLLGSAVALAVNLIVCFWIAQRMRPRLVGLLRRFDYELPHFGPGERSPLRFTIAVKLAPGIPPVLKNYGLALAGVPFRVFFALSMLLTGAWAVWLVVLGEALLEHRVDRIAGAVLLILVLALTVKWWRRRRHGARRAVPASAS